ncbi:MAG TPA: DUF1801 domain-containing protein [Ilumatobacteraceae bacterium]|nr:DUF1801 domain-containing protein [Ilumatobacteraceae bacterium]
METTTNPKKHVIAAVREVILSDDRISEGVKYRAPAFLYFGIMAYFHWSAKEYASLIFPLGSRIPGRFDLLHGDGLQRVARFADLAAVEAGRDELLDLVDEWCTIA